MLPLAVAPRIELAGEPLDRVDLEPGGVDPRAVLFASILHSVRNLKRVLNEGRGPLFARARILCCEGFIARQPMQDRSNARQLWIAADSTERIAARDALADFVGCAAIVATGGIAH